MSRPLHSSRTDVRNWFGRLRTVLYVLLPVLILGFIFTRIDLAELRANFSKTDPVLVTLGVCFYPLVIAVGAVRWRTVVQSYLEGKTPLGFMLRHYWIGLCLGLFAPGSMGWDLYRIVVVGRRFGGFVRGIMVVLVEKVLALVNVILLIVVLFPIVTHLIVRDRALAEQVYEAAVAVLVVMCGGVAVSALIKKGNLGPAIWSRSQQFLSGRLKRVGAALNRSIEIKPESLSYGALVRPVLRPGVAAKIFFLSLSITFLSASMNQIFFRSIGYEIPFVVNLFIAPVLFFIFILPISFGSLGIREGAYILVHGIFGVPAETALLVSFFNLTGVILNNLVGALLIWAGGRVDRDGSAGSAT